MWDLKLKLIRLAREFGVGSGNGEGMGAVSGGT